MRQYPLLAILTDFSIMKPHYLLFIFSFFLSELTAQQLKPTVGYESKWIEYISFNKEAVPVSGQESSVYYLLLDEQENVSTQEYYLHYVYKINSNEGLQQMSDINIEFDPAYETLTFHRVLLHRNGQVIDQLPKSIKTIQREDDLERNLYDGSLTSIINLKDVRVGDVIEYSYTRRGYNPVYENFFSRRISLNYNVPVEKISQRLLVPHTNTLTFKKFYTDEEPVVKKNSNLIEYTWERMKVSAYITDNNAPNWYNPYETILVTNFKDWAQVANWAARRYQVSESEKNKIKKELATHFKSTSPEDFINEAIQFVQDDIRYLGFESGLNSHKPHPPTQILNQRFGDCKDKSLLLVTLLNVNGIESYPVLVNTTYRHEISNQLPSINSFDHCIVQIKYNNETFYVDPTIGSQGGEFNHRYFPTYGKGLVVSEVTKDLSSFPEPVESSIHEVQVYDVPALGGEAFLHVETTYEGAEADYQRSTYSSSTLESIQKNFLTYYANLYPDIEKVSMLEVLDDRSKNTFLVKEHYRIPNFWKEYTDSKGKIYFELYPQALENYFNISKSAQRTSPYRLEYPLHYVHEINVNLPEDWPITPENETLENRAYYYHHTVGIDDKKLQLFTEYETKAESVPVEDFRFFASDHEKMMKNLSYSLSYDKNVVAKTKNTTPGLLLTLIALALGVYLVFWLYTTYNPEPEFSSAWAQPLGGWLIFIGLGVVFTPIRILFDLVSDTTLLSGETWLAFWYSRNYGNFLFVFLEHIYNVILLIFSCLLVVLFFQRKSSFPLLMSIRLGSSAFIVILDSYYVHQINPEINMDTKGIVQAIFGAAVWIPYLQTSQRVKKTFVVRNQDPDSSSAAI